MKIATYIALVLLILLAVFLGVYFVYKQDEPTPTQKDPAFPDTGIVNQNPPTNQNDVGIVPIPTTPERQLQEITPTQRASIKKESVPYGDYGDEASFILSATSKYNVFFTEVDDSFRIELLDIKPTLEDRLNAERVITQMLGVAEDEICSYRTEIRIVDSPFVLPSAVTNNNCFVAN